MKTLSDIQSKAVSERPPRVAFVNREFPSLTQTFHYAEYRALQTTGKIRLDAWAFKRPGLVAADAQALVTETRYLPPLASWSAFVAVVRAIARRPWQALSAAVGILIRSRPGNREGGMLGAVAFSVRGVQLADAMRDDVPDLIHSQFATEGATAALVASRVLGVPFSFEAHSPFTLYRRHRLLAYKVRHARFVTAISECSRSEITSFCGDGAAPKLHVLHCGIACDVFGKLAAANADGRTILCVGSLVPFKGHRFLIEAAAKLRDRGMSFQCEIIGRGKCHDELAAMIARLGLQDCVRLRGPLPNDQVREMLKAAALFVLASSVEEDGTRDGVPVVLMEAMAAGVPCVSTDVSGIPELIRSPEEGILVEQKNPAALADAIETLLKDASLRERISRAARARIEREFNLEKSAEQLAQLFRRYTSPGGAQ